MPSALELILAGKIDQKEKNTQGHSVKHRNQKQEPVHGIALHLLQKDHNILSRDGKNHVKGNNRNHQGAEKSNYVKSSDGYYYLVYVDSNSGKVKKRWVK